MSPKRITILVLAGLLLATTAFGHDDDGPIEEQPERFHNFFRCDVMIATGTAQINQTLTQVVSEFDIQINGQQYSGSSDGIVMGVIEAEEDGTTTFLTSSDWSIPRLGTSFTTVDEVLVEPPNADGVSRSQLRRKVITGSGRYNCGEILDESTVTVNGEVEFLQIVGKLCRCR